MINVAPQGEDQEAGEGHRGAGAAEGEFLQQEDEPGTDLILGT